jgi:hypothetical protein
VHWAPGIPHALIFLLGGRFIHNSGASRREIAETRRHCEERSDEAIQLSLWPHGLLRGAFHRAALRADPLARNDDLKLSWLFEN